MRKQVNVGKRIVRYFSITVIFMAFELSIGSPSTADMGSNSPQSVTVHELVTCDDRMLSTLINSSNRYNNLVAQNIQLHRCEGSLVKFTAAEIITLPESPEVLAIYTNIEETFKEVEEEDAIGVALTLTSGLNNLPTTVIEFEDQNHRDEFIAKLREEEALRLEFSSSDDEVGDFLAIRIRHVPYSIITVTPLEEKL